jgi:hypothetical protein
LPTALGSSTFEFILVAFAPFLADILAFKAIAYFSMSTTSPAMTVVLARAAELEIKIELRDKRTVYLDRRPCQAIQSKWHENFRHWRGMSMYMPRHGFADFLLYVAEGKNTVYVVPRGIIKHDTVWAEDALEP